MLDMILGIMVLLFVMFNILGIAYVISKYLELSGTSVGIKKFLLYPFIRLFQNKNAFGILQSIILAIFIILPWALYVLATAIYELGHEIHNLGIKKPNKEDLK